MQLEGAFSYNFQLVDLYTTNNANVDYDKQLLLYASSSTCKKWGKLKKNSEKCHE